VNLLTNDEQNNEAVTLSCPHSHTRHVADAKLGGSALECDAVWLDSDRLCAVVCLIDADQSICQLKHVVTQ